MLSCGSFSPFFFPNASKVNVTGSLKSNSCRNLTTCTAFCRKKWESFLAVLFDYNKSATVFALRYPVQVFINLNNGTSVIRKFLCLLKALKKVWSQYVDANFGRELWKDFWLTVAQNLSILLLAYFGNSQFIYRTIIYPTELVYKSEFSFLKKRYLSAPRS